MATFTITSDTNIDALSGKAGDDTYNINGATLTIDQHSRYGLNNNTSATAAAVTASATLGGTLAIEGRYSRLIPFDGASGTVPADNTAIAGAAGSGLLYGIYDTVLNAAPLAPGAAMPASGYALVKQWNSGAYVDNEALTGITANVCIDHILGTGTDRAGWVEVVSRGGTASNWTLSRLNNPTTPVCYGIPYTIGITDGTRSTTYQIPSNGVNQYHGGVFVETGTGTGLYDPYPVTSDNMTDSLVPTTAEKGKWCKIDYATGLVRFGHDGTNSSGGYCPPAGRRILIGNIFMTGADSASKTQNSYSAATSSRGRWIVSGAGRVDCRWTSFNWGFGSITNPQYFNLEGCSVVDNMTITNPAIAPTFTDTVIGSPIGFTATNLTSNSNPLGITIENTVIGKSGFGATANSYCIALTDTSNVSMTGGGLVHTGTKATNSQYSLVCSRATNVSLDECLTSMGWSISSTTSMTVTGGQFYGAVVANDITNGIYMLNATTQSSDIVIDGVRIDDGDLPAAGLFLGGSSCSDITLRNMGAYNDPIKSSIPDAIDVSVSRSGTTATVTSVAHGMVTGNIIMISRFEIGATSVSRTSYTVTVVDPDTFTITVLNSGSTSYKISYYGGHQLRLTTLANSSNIKFQNIHVRSSRSGAYSMDNSSQDIYFENVTTDWVDGNAVATSANNLRMYGASQNPLNQTAASSVYGTHMLSTYVGDVGVPNGIGVSYSRSSSTVTVTNTDHGLYTGSRIQVLYSDNQTGAYTAQIATATVSTKDVFTFSGANAGATSGTLDYKTADGMVNIICNEDNAASTAQFSVLSGTPLFTGTGGLLMGTVGDSVEWVMERYDTDFDFAENMLPFMAGGTISDYTLTYDIDTGSGYSGSFKNAYYERATGSGTAASTTVSVADTTGIAVGDYVYGIGIATGAKVASITNATDFVVDIANANTVSGTLRFSYLPNITSIPADGFKLKVRCTTVTTNTNAITYIRMFFRSTNTTRANLYSQVTLPTQTVTISGATAGSRIQIKDMTSSTELYNGTPTFPYTWTDTAQYEADREIRLRVSYVNGTSAKKFIEATIGTATIASPDVTYLVNQEDDTVYNTNAVDGSTVTDITINDTDARYDVEADLTLAQVYAKAMYEVFTETGIRDLGLAIEAVDTANYIVTGRDFKNTSSPSVPVTISGGWVVDGTTGNAIDLVDTTGGTLFLAPDHVVAYASASDYVEIADAVAAQADISLTNVLVKDKLS